MDITDITDIQTLKALAYDQMVLQEQVQHNLAVIHARIAELQAQQIEPEEHKTLLPDAGNKTKA